MLPQDNFQPATVAAPIAAANAAPTTWAAAADTAATVADAAAADAAAAAAVAPVAASVAPATNMRPGPVRHRWCRQPVQL